MNNSIKEGIWKQFRAGIDMLANAIAVCPEEHWDTDRKFWYNAYHCLFFLDYYLTMEPTTFSPPHHSPFQNLEMKCQVGFPGPKLTCNQTAHATGNG